MIMCLGESTTARGGKDSWPAQLEEVLNKRSGAKKFRVINKGVEGVNTSKLLFNLNENLNRYNPHLVIAMMGVNDEMGLIPYEDSAYVKTLLFLDNFRTRKLYKIIRSRIVHKFEEWKAAKRKKGKAGIELVPEELRGQDSKTCQEQLAASEHELAEAVESNLRNIELYVRRAECYRLQGEFGKAEEVLKKALSVSPKDENILFQLAMVYFLEERFGEAEEILGKALEINKRFSAGYIALADCYRRQRRSAEAVGLLTKAIEIGVPPDENIYITMGNAFFEMGEMALAEATFKKALEANPQCSEAYTELGILYRSQGRLKDLYILADKIKKENMVVDRMYGFIGTCYREQKKYKEAEEFFKKAEALRLQFYNPQTKHNYLKLREILSKRGLPLVCVQYPLRSIVPLQLLFDSKENVFFVDNEHVFKKALRDSQYSEYFTDNFGGEFGHATAKGNRLIAENVANVILTEVLKAPLAYKAQDNENVVP